ncbi:MAG TPA: discoidin domain-containing protein [Xanthobacteraceae bacterium]|nr:discoidin domain-containing protein [Xanthobacteraceae bacterium]
MKVSPDGEAWQEAIVISRANANVALKSSLTLSGRITPDALTANANDYAPDGFASASVLRISGTATREITGLAGGSDGRIVIALNVGAYPLTLKHESASSSADNRFGFPADVVLAGKQAALFWYDSTSARWKLLAGPAPSSSGGLDDATRRNLRLANIALAKSRGAYLRLLGEFADGYAASGGINAGASSNYAHDGSNKLAKPGTVAGSDEATSAFAISSGDFDGTHTKGKAFDNTNGTSNEWYSQQLSSTPVNGNAWIGQDFGAGNTKDIRSVTIKQGYNDANARVSSAKVQYSDNGSAWTDVQTLSLATDTSVQSFSLPSSGARRYWRLLANANTAGGLAWVVDEIEFRGGDTINNMTLVTATQTADTAPSSIRALLEIEAVDAITLDTDLTVEVSRDGGTTWTSAALSECGGTSSGRIAAESAETSVSVQPSGSSVCARIKTFNNKRVNIHGLDLRWS